VTKARVLDAARKYIQPDQAVIRIGGKMFPILSESILIQPHLFLRCTGCRSRISAIDTG